MPLTEDAVVVRVNPFEYDLRRSTVEKLARAFEAVESCL
jgi:hypothetical protein